MRQPTRAGSRRLPGRAFLALIVGLAAGLGGSSAHAQFGYGWGWGLGYQTPAVVNYTYQRANIAEGAAYANRPTNLTAPARPPRDVDFFERYDPQTLQAMENRVARNPRTYYQPPPAPTAVAVATPSPAAGTPTYKSAPLSSFFNQYDEVVWPTDAPVTGGLQAERTVSDQASRAVLKEYNTDGLAKVATVTDARNKLLDYGRPALEFVRTHTPPVADTFHGYLLSLYDAIGRAAIEPKK